MDLARWRSIPTGWFFHVGMALLFTALLVTVSPALAQNKDPAAILLFADESPLALTIAMDFDAVLKDRAEERAYQPATLYEVASGAETAHAIGIKTRGYYRLHYLNCDVPPLRLNFRKSEVGETVFDGQDKLKLVTHCRTKSDRYQQHVFQEYLIYRSYNLLTDASFRTRLVHLKYVDTRGRHDSITGFGFLIEDDDAMAERNGGSIIGTGVRIFPDAIDRDAMTLLSVFQYMVGNTDWTISTYHNVRLVFRNSTRTIVAVPYDFDWSGLIAAPYATPSIELNLRSVRERKFMGPCRREEELAEIFERIRGVEDEMLALFGDFSYLEERYAQRSIDYLKGFFETIQNPRKIGREFGTGCW